MIYWKREITTINSKVMDKMHTVRGNDCGYVGNWGINQLGEIYGEMLQYKVEGPPKRFGP